MPAVAELPPYRSETLLSAPVVVDRAKGLSSAMQLHGTTATLAAQEAFLAIRRFLIGKGFRDTTFHQKACMLDPLTAMVDMRAFARSQGADLDEMIAGAARQFSSPQIIRRTEPLSPKELEFLLEDDQRALGR
jgi:hypothetical protein